MHRGRVARPDVDRGDVRVLRQRRRHREAAVHVAGHRRRIRFGVRKHEIGLAERPSAVEVFWRWKIGEGSLRRAVVDPFRDGVDLVLPEHTRLGEVAARRRRLPGRHLMRLRHVLDGVGMRRGVAVRHQRERRDVAGVMAALAAVLEDADDFIAEGRTVSHLRRGRMQHGALARGDEREDEGGRENDAAHVRDGTSYAANDSRPYLRVLMTPPSYAIFPSTIVRTLFVAGSASAGTRKMSCDNTARSASLPAAMVPFSFSANSANALPRVYASSASSRVIPSA